MPVNWVSTSFNVSPLRFGFRDCENRRLGPCSATGSCCTTSWSSRKNISWPRAVRTVAIESESELVEIVVDLVGYRYGTMVGCPATERIKSVPATRCTRGMKMFAGSPLAGNGSRLMVIALVRQIHCRLTSHRFGQVAPRRHGCLDKRDQARSQPSSLDATHSGSRRSAAPSRLSCRNRRRPTWSSPVACTSPLSRPPT